MGIRLRGCPPSFLCIDPLAYWNLKFSRDQRHREFILMPVPIFHQAQSAPRPMGLVFRTRTLAMPPASVRFHSGLGHPQIFF